MWRPPARLGYLWYLGRDRAGATVTTIEIEHRGWERLGTEGEQWRDRNRAGWHHLLPHFAAAITRGDRRWPLAPRTTRGS